MNTLVKPTIRGDRVILRPLAAGDADAMYASLQDAEGNRLTGTQRSFTQAEIRRWCEGVGLAEGRIDCAITSPEDGRYLGEAVLNDIDEVNRSANFRIALAGPELYGRCFGSEAARLLLAYGFQELELNRIELEVFAFNPRALRVYEKLGFKREGVRREVLFMDGNFHDSIVMGVLASEFSGGAY